MTRAGESSPEAGRTGHRGETPKPRVLVAAAANGLASELEAALDWCCCLRVATGEALRRAVDEHGDEIDLVLLDEDLDADNGVELVKARLPQIPVLVLLDDSREHTLVSWLGRGASDALVKPVETVKLETVVRRALRRKSGRRLARSRPSESNIQARAVARGWVELTSPSRFEYLARLQRFTNLLFASNLPEEECEALRMAVEEIGRNAIEWGNRLDPSKQLKISYCLFNDRVVLKFEDEGEGFHPETLGDPSADPRAVLEQRRQEGKRPGGFGVFLIQNLMDEVVYSEKGNVVLTTKFFKRRPKADGSRKRE